MSRALPIVANGSLTVTASTDDPSLIFNFLGQILTPSGTVTIPHLTDAAPVTIFMPPSATQVVVDCIAQVFSTYAPAKATSGPVLAGSITETTSQGIVNAILSGGGWIRPCLLAPS